MSNGHLSKWLRRPTVPVNFYKYRVVQTRYISPKKKFPVPPSFLPHLKANHGRKKSQDGTSTGTATATVNSFPAVKKVVPARMIPNAEALNSTVEQQLDNIAGHEFGMNMEPMIERFYGRPHHPEIAWFMKGYVTRAPLVAMDQFIRLWNALRNILPEDPLNGPRSTTPQGSLKHVSYMRASLRDHAAADGPFSHIRMNMGWHLIMFNPPILGNKLLFDGTDDRFLPGPSGIWKHRLWAGGSINLYRSLPKSLPDSNFTHQVESPVDLRIVGKNQTPEKLFVTVRKRFVEVQGKIRLQDYKLPVVASFLKKDPIYSDHSLTGGPWLEETYMLCFLRDAPDLSKKATSTRVIAPPIQPKFSHSLTPDRHLLFCWSALTYNAHRIHLDQAFAHKEYGAPDLVVQGTLTLLLILEWFQRQITRYAIERQLSKFHLVSIDYKVLMPTYVDETIRLCTKPTKFQTPGTLAESWEVWIERDLEDGQKTMTFKGTIKLKTESDEHNTRGRLGS